MYPFIYLFNIPLSTYALMSILGALLLVLVSLYLARKKALILEDLIFMLSFALVGAFIGAKLLYQIPRIYEIWRYRAIIFSSLETFNIYFSSGFVFYGGLIGAAIGVIFYCKKFKVDIIDYMQCIIPGIPLFHCLARIGCFLSGCCYGVETDANIGYLYHNHLDIIGAPDNVYLLPVQLIESFSNIIIFILIIFVIHKYKHLSSLFTLGMYSVLYGILRFILEFYRGDAQRGIYFFLSTSQWISLLIVPFGLYCLIKPDKQNRIYQYLCNQPI